MLTLKFIIWWQNTDIIIIGWPTGGFASRGHDPYRHDQWRDRFPPMGRRERWVVSQRNNSMKRYTDISSYFQKKIFSLVFSISYDLKLFAYGIIWRFCSHYQLHTWFCIVFLTYMCISLQILCTYIYVSALFVRFTSGKKLKL